jgi:hypothetical protein
LMVMSVPERVNNLKILGGKPKPNSSTSILDNLAAIKCPNSCKNINKPNAKINSMSVTNPVLLFM